MPGGGTTHPTGTIHPSLRGSVDRIRMEPSVLFRTAAREMGGGVNPGRSRAINSLSSPNDMAGAACRSSTSRVVASKSSNMRHLLWWGLRPGSTPAMGKGRLGGGSGPLHGWMGPFSEFRAVRGRGGSHHSRGRPLVEEVAFVADDCIFCRIVAGEIPAQVVHDDDRALVFRDVNPQAPTHLLVIPKRHVVSADHLGPEDEGLAGHLLLAAGEAARSLDLAGDGYRIVTNIGRDGGQTVSHLHLHVLGGRRLDWPPG